MSEEAASDTLTDATGTGLTISVAVPVTPSLVAVIVAVPTDNVLTSPVLETVATAALSEAHVI
jgi:hypothetical protein